MTDTDSAPLDRIAWPIRTERLSLRAMTADDVDAVFEIRSDPEVAHWITSRVTNRDEIVEWFAETRGRQTVVVERGGTVVGDLMLRVEDAWSQREVRDAAAGQQAELGWLLHPTHAGRGYATEAVSALIGLCFGPLGLRRVVAHCFAGNTASWRLMERLGMRREAHTVRDSLHRSGEWLDGYSYALLADEWRAARPDI